MVHRMPMLLAIGGRGIGRTNYIFREATMVFQEKLRKICDISSKHPNSASCRVVALHAFFSKRLEKQEKHLQRTVHYRMGPKGHIRLWAWPSQALHRNPKPHLGAEVPSFWPPFLAESGNPPFWCETPAHGKKRGGPADVAENLHLVFFLVWQMIRWFGLSRAPASCDSRGSSDFNPARWRSNLSLKKNLR